VYETEADVADTAIAERFIDLLDTDRKCAVDTKGAALRALCVEQHNVNGNRLGLQCKSLCIRQWYDRRGGANLVGFHRCIGTQIGARISSGLQRSMIGRELARVSLDNGLQVAAQP
jgi:hypothetical protein